MYFDFETMNKREGIKPLFALGLVMITIIGMMTVLITQAADQDFAGTELSVKVDKLNKAVKVSVRTGRINSIQFYMFNVEGKLVKQYDINGPKKFEITELENGIYLYDFFNRDQRLKTGKIELK